MVLRVWFVQVRAGVLYQTVADNSNFVFWVFDWIGVLVYPTAAVSFVRTPEKT